MSHTIIFPNAKFWVDDEEEVLYCKFKNCKSYRKLEVPRVMEYIDVILEVTNKTPMPFIIDLRNTKGRFEHKAAKLFATHPDLHKIKQFEAFVINNIGMKLLILTYKRLYDPYTPFKIFSSQTAALEYCLKTQIKLYAIN
ncbi:MAG: hypothetical protein KJO41_00340 [Bacteroidia bacterium]|nr:hypothetical protein [Bacteroidia bacterium]NND24458.1 hypothetical protein [Flavobacteriaceae bacterium]NNK60821.1 hypothetical protein [Flavobacteriaceae bacterium]NNL32452.1 hypothetical protein [Flavobacteriaceae bacterium]